MTFPCPAIGKIILIVLLGTTFACKKLKDTSDTQSLDNLAADSITFHQCSGSIRLVPEAGKNYPNESHLVNALKAVPEEMQTSFFKDYHGIVRKFSSGKGKDLQDFCPQSNANRQDERLGCVHLTGDATHPMEIILLAATPEKEAYTLVRVFAAFFVDWVITRDVQKSQAIKYGNFDQGLKRELLTVFLMESTKLTKDRDGFKDALRTMGLSQSVWSDDALLTGFFNQDYASVQRKLEKAVPDDIAATLGTRVFIEALHSAFCSVETRRTSLRDFHETMALIAPYAGRLDPSFKKDLANIGPEGRKLTASADRPNWLSVYQPVVAVRRSAKADLGAEPTLKGARQAMKDQAASKSATLALGGGLFGLGGPLSFLFSGQVNGNGNYPTNQNGNYPTNQNGNYPTNQNGNYPTNQNGNYPTNQNGNYPTNQNGNYPTNQNGNYPTNQNGNYPTNQNGNYPTNQNGNYPTNQNGNNPANQNGAYPPNQGGPGLFGRLFQRVGLFGGGNSPQNYATNPNGSQQGGYLPQTNGSGYPTNSPYDTNPNSGYDPNSAGPQINSGNYPGNVPQVTQPSSNGSGSDMLQQVNILRTSRGLPSLREDTDLTNRACKLAQDNANDGTGNRHSGDNVYENACCDSVPAGSPTGVNENQAFIQWENSPAHLANMLQPGVTLMGYCNRGGKNIMQLK